MDQEQIAQLEADARRGEDARQSLRGMVFAFEALRADLNNQMSAVKSTDEVMKSKLIDMWKLTDALERWFRITIETGEAAVIQLEERKKFLLFKRA